MVVMLLIAVMLSIGILGIASARKSGSRVLGVATARAYEQAIDRYAAAHGGQVPSTNGVDWPPAEAARGPVTNVMGTRKYYLRTVPESIVDKRVVVGINAVPTAVGAQSTLTYRIDGSGYRIEVRTVGRPDCAIYGQGGDRGGGEPPTC